jgi:hypothetical protein
MSSPDRYLAIVVAGMFVVGIVLLIRWKRQRSKKRQRWTRGPGR